MKITLNRRPDSRFPLWIVGSAQFPDFSIWSFGFFSIVRTINN